IAAGGAFNHHSLALKSDGTVWAWGANSAGQLGNGSFTGSNTPVQTSGINGVTAIAGGQLHSLALKSDGTVWAWGYNLDGELGNGTYTDSNTPVEVSGLSGVTVIAGGGFHSLALVGATPPQAINSLIGQVISPSLGFSNGEKTSLTAKLRAALGYLQAGDAADAIAVLQAFINQVNALVNSGRLTTAAAAPLISAAEGAAVSQTSGRRNHAACRASSSVAKSCRYRHFSFSAGGPPTDRRLLRLRRSPTSKNIALGTDFGTRTRDPVRTPVRRPLMTLPSTLGCFAEDPSLPPPLGRQVSSTFPGWPSPARAGRETAPAGCRHCGCPGLGSRAALPPAPRAARRPGRPHEHTGTPGARGKRECGRRARAPGRRT
ncbi:MAG: hypothetical protein DMD49_10690, partial [Gemmatimonadetes bacterium]